MAYEYAGNERDANEWLPSIKALAIRIGALTGATRAVRAIRVTRATRAIRAIRVTRVNIQGL